MNDPVAAWRAGAISAEIAIARMLLAGIAPQGVRARAEAGGGALAEAARAAALPALAAMLRAARIDHAAASPAAIAAMFDAAASHAPEAAVALHSLGDPARLARATAEIVAWLGATGLLGGDVLDLGCGIGRIAAAVAPHARFVLGVEIAAAMLAEARRRATAPNVAFARGDGTGLAFLADAWCDLVLAVDCFPYLVMAGTAARHVAEAARVLRPGGTLVVLNLSYGEESASDFASWTAGLCSIEVAGAQPFRLWDGTAFVARKA